MDELKKIEVIEDEKVPPKEETTEEVVKEPVEEKKGKRLRLRPRLSLKGNLFKKRKIWGLVAGLAVVLVVFVLAAVIPGLIVINKARAVYQESQGLIEAVKAKDLKLISERTTASKEKLASLESSLRPLAWVRFIPFIGAYEADAVHLVRAGEAGLEAAEIVVKTIEPYADIIGFAGGEEPEGGEKTAEDRINFIVTTLDKIAPEIEKVGEKVMIAKNEVDQINPNRYPEELRGQKIREPLKELVTLIDQGATLTHEAKPIFDVSPWLLGIEEKRTYLVIFQNDGELRPTGGFLTAYAILEVEKGKVKPILSEDMYAADARFGSKIEAPEVIVKYLTPNIPYWKLRDMNLSPDFKISMETFLENFQETTNYEFDGVITVDTEVLVRLLDVLGPIGVPEWGNFSTEPDDRCDGCPQVVYVLELMADKPVSELRSARKAVLGPLMHSIIANAMGSPKERIPGLFNAGFTSVMEKHVLFYFPDEKVQSAMEAFNIAGRIREYEGDFFHLNDCNFGGAKANMFIEQKVSQKIKKQSDGSIVKTVTVEYRNPSPHSRGCDLEAGGLCLNAPYRDWFRFYVPKGSELLESQGSEEEVKTYEELGKTVFEGYYGKDAPLYTDGGLTRLIFKYKLPFKAEGGDYRLLIQKQPGTDGHLYEVELGKQKEEFELKQDKEVKLKI
jgi:hypothetical protein